MAAAVAGGASRPGGHYDVRGVPRRVCDRCYRRVESMCRQLRCFGQSSCVRALRPSAAGLWPVSCLVTELLRTESVDDRSIDSEVSNLQSIQRQTSHQVQRPEYVHRHLRRHHKATEAALLSTVIYHAWTWRDYRPGNAER